MDESQKPFKYMPSPRLMRNPLLQNSTGASFEKIPKFSLNAIKDMIESLSQIAKFTFCKEQTHVFPIQWPKA